MSGLHTISNDSDPSARRSSSSRRLSTTTAHKRNSTGKPTQTLDDIGLVGASDTADAGDGSETSGSDTAGSKQLFASASPHY